MKKLPLLLALVAAASCQRQAPPAEPDAGVVPVAQPAPPPPPADPLAAAGLERAAFAVDGPFETSLRAVVGDEIAPPLAQVTARLLVWWVNVQRELRKGDKIEVIYERPPGKEPLIHALRFFSNKDGKEHRAYLYQPKGSAFTRYFDETGAEVEERLVDSPIDDYDQVTSVLRDGRGHKGVDFKTPVGTPVKMPMNAHLTRKNWNFRGNGNCLEFKDAQGRRIVFLHLDVLPKDLVVGRLYRTGEVIASSGNSGHSTAPHLHYQLENVSGRLLDPFTIHKTYRKHLETTEIGEFQTKRDGYDRMFDWQAGAAAAVVAPAVAAPATAAPAPAVPAPVPAAAPPPPAAGLEPEPPPPADLAL